MGTLSGNMSDDYCGYKPNMNDNCGIIWIPLWNINGRPIGTTLDYGINIQQELEIEWKVP